MTRILLIEEDTPIRRALKRSLEDRGDAVVVAPNGMKGLRLALSESPEVVLLDPELSDIDGLRLIAMLRGVSEVPVIVVNAQDDDRQVIKALDTGADDYLVADTGTEKLQARIRAILRRTNHPADGNGPVVVAGLSIDPRSRAATLDGERLELSRKEFDLLFLLASRAGEVVTKKELLATIWQQSYGGAERSVDVHMSWLRRKLGETASEPRYLRSVRGVGVRLVAPGVE